MTPDRPTAHATPAASYQTYEMGFYDYLRIFRKRWRIVVLTVVAGLFGAAAYTSTLPRVYVASASLEIHPPKEAALAGLKYRGPIPADVYNAMRTREFAGRVAARLHGAGLVPDTDPAGVQAGVSISRGADRGEGSNRFTVSVQGTDPVRIAAVANAYVEEAAFWVADFLEEQRRQLRRYLVYRLEHAETLVASANELLQEYDRRKAEVAAAEAALAALEEERARLEDLAAERENIVRRLDSIEAAAEIRSSDPNVQSLADRIASLQAERAEILERFTPSHPRIGAIASEITRTMPRLRRAVEEAYERADRRWAEIQAREAEARDRLAAAKTALDAMENPYILQQRARLRFDQFGAIANRIEEERFADALEEGNVEVTSRATPPQAPAAPSYRLHVTAGGTIGLLVGLALVFVLESLDTSIGTIEDVEAYLGLPVLGVIPFIRPAAPPADAKAKDGASSADAAPRLGPMLTVHHSPNSVPSEAYRALRTHILSLLGEARHKVFLITSAGPQEGKSTTTANLAATFARTGSKTLFIEANMRRPTAHKVFGLPRAPGLGEALMGADWKGAVREVSGIPNLHVLPAGAAPTENPAELLLRPRLAEILDEARPAFDYVLIDAPPTLPVADPAIIAAAVDEVILVYYVGKAAREAILRAKTHLAQAGGKFRGHLLGVVLNHLQPEAQAGYYYYYYHSRYYGA